MTNEEIIDDFVTLFRGRGDAYGSAKGFCVHKPLNRATFAQHLTSTNPDDHIGVYCMIGDRCSWGCIDIDGKDFPAPRTDIDSNWEWDWEKMRTLARNLQTVLAAKNIPAHRERTKNGFHVWVFPGPHPLVSAATMRRALMAACKAIGYDPKEVNPKAEGPREGTQGLGNFVRLPYGGCLTAPRDDRMFEHDEDDVRITDDIDDFVTLMDDPNQYARLEDLEAVAALWTPPPPPAPVPIDTTTLFEVQRILKELDGKTYTIWRDGPLDGSDRSTTLARLAHLVFEQGRTASECFAIIKTADARWGGKFNLRADGDVQLARIVENAYA